jgi:hypothetical protein
LGLAARWREPQNILPPPITERVKKLRQEIAELTEKNRRYSLNPKYGSAVADNERRFSKIDRNRRRIEKFDGLEKNLKVRAFLSPPTADPSTHF